MTAGVRERTLGDSPVLSLPSRLVTPERLYMAALALSGSAALVSIALPPTERGQLVASMAGGTLGSAIGGFSIDTFLLSRSEGWVLSRGRSWVMRVSLACIVISAAVAVLVIAVAGVGSYFVAAGAASALTVFNASASLALRIKKFMFVYSIRAASAATLVAGYAWLYIEGQISGSTWSIAWLVIQSLAAATLGCFVLHWAVSWYRGAAAVDIAVATAPELREDLSAMAKLHVGVCAQMLTVRLDQILLARFAGAAALGVYALAVAALEFAQAGTVVQAQRILARRESTETLPRAYPVIKAAFPIALFSVIALTVVGIVQPQYSEAWILGLVLLPGCLAACTGKIWSALLLKQRGEQATTTVAVVTLAVAIPSYLVAIPWTGAVGAALAVSCAYAVYALASRQSLRGSPQSLTHWTV